MTTRDAHTRAPYLDALQRRVLLTGGGALALCVLGLLINPAQFFRSYLIGAVYWVGISLGCLVLLMLHCQVMGGWGTAITRFLIAGVRSLPAAFLLALPVSFGLRHVYSWSNPELVAHDPVLLHKVAYLNQQAFGLRSLFYFFVWCSLAFLIGRRLRRFEETGDASAARGLTGMTAVGLVVFALTASFAGVDWLMSLEPHWYSTIYGGLLAFSFVLTGLAFVVAAAARFGSFSRVVPVTAPAQLQDLGTLMMAFVMIWAYLHLSQFLLIWSANLPEETPWYLARISGGWKWIGISLALFHFATPFMMLLSRRVKRSARKLCSVALLILFMHYIDLLWLVVPAFHPGNLRIHFMDILAPIAIGGFWIAMFIRQLRSAPLRPLELPAE